MKFEILTVCNHQLDVSDVEKLANDLAPRFSMSVEYGYEPTSKYSKLLKWRYSEDLVFVGKATGEKVLERSALVDLAYEEKAIIEKFGQQTLLDNDGSQTSESVLKQMNYRFFSKRDDHFAMDIYNQYACIEAFEWDGWDSFCSFFDGSMDLKSSEAYRDVLISSRKEVLEMCGQLGGDTAYYMHSSMDVRLRKDPTTAKSDVVVIDIARFFTDEEYEDSFDEIHPSQVIFIDNFSDLK